MFTSFNKVRDEIRTLFFETYKVKAENVLGFLPEVYFDSLPTDDQAPDNSKGYGILQITTEGEKQSGISANVKEAGKRKFEIAGIIIFQLFLPKTIDGYEDFIISILEEIKEQFRRPNIECLWFRRAKIKPLPMEQILGRGNFYCEFYYNEVG